MAAKNVGSLSPGSPASLSIIESTPGRSPTGAASAGRPFSRSHTSSSIRGRTPGRSPMGAASVGRPSPRTHALSFTRGPIWGGSPTSAPTAGRPSLRRPTSSDTTEFTPGKSSMGEMRGKVSSRSHSMSRNENLWIFWMWKILQQEAQGHWTQRFILRWNLTSLENWENFVLLSLVVGLLMMP